MNLWDWIRQTVSPPARHEPDPRSFVEDEDEGIRKINSLIQNLQLEMNPDRPTAREMYGLDRKGRLVRDS